MVEIPNVRLSLSNRAENVLLVRQALSGLAETIGLDPLELNDVNTAVSEACNNVVVHAYGGEPGPLEVDVCSHPVGLCVLVRDHGRGISSTAQAVAEREAVGGIGLPVIRALTHNVEFRDLPKSGTEVRMEFATARAGALQRPLHADGLDARVTVDHELADTTAMAIAPTALARTVLPRVLSALAARAYFSTDRIFDTQLLADALVAHTDDSLSASHLNVAVAAAPRNLELRIGPLHRGHADALIHDSTVDGLGSVLRRLADGHEVTSTGSCEVLALSVAERR
jgi:serine/threonine-protein kinase RsbW